MRDTSQHGRGPRRSRSDRQPSSSPRRCCNRMRRRPRKNCRTRSVPGFLPQARIHVAVQSHRGSAHVPTADRCDNAHRWGHYHVRPIDRSWHERAELPDDLSCPRQCGSRPRQWAADPVQGGKRAQARKPSREKDRGRECVHRPPPRGASLRPLSCAKANTQIRTDSPIIFFIETSSAISRQLLLVISFSDPCTQQANSQVKMSWMGRDRSHSVHRCGLEAWPPPPSPRRGAQASDCYVGSINVSAQILEIPLLAASLV